ncbi:NAD-dependent epimerase/dehydratase family protein [Pelagibacterales bacterium SAG-MED23]|nr:NAD-dependent epimerase/dehydratase family protein [Pelagibacterales bacterium SAG-MED23]
MKKILITGGAGFIGYHLTKKLSKNNYVTILDNFSRGKMDGHLKRLKSSKNVKILSKDLNKKINLKTKFDYIFHLAATVGVKNVLKKPTFTFENNILPSLNLINYIIENNKNCKFIFFSTSEVYSPLIQLLKKKIFPLKENYNLIIPNKIAKRDSYFLSKLFIENFIKISGIKFIIYRPHNIYGPRMGKSHVIPELIDKIVLKNIKKIKIFSPKHKRVFCYIDDCIQQILESYKKSNNLNSVINLGSKQKEITMLNLAKLIKKLSNQQKIIIGGSNTPGSPIRRIPCTKKIYNNLKNYKEVRLDEGIIKTIKWYSDEKYN